jgi:hypothetical protein
MNRSDKIKHHFRNLLVDAASVVIVLAIAFAFMQGFTTLYTSWYNTEKLPSPGDFQAAGYQFTGAISLVYMLTLTRKHRKEKQDQPEESKVTETKTTTDTKTTVT